MIVTTLVYAQLHMSLCYNISDRLLQHKITGVTP